MRTICTDFSANCNLSGDCEKPVCEFSTESLPLPQARSLQPKADAFVQPPDDGALMASYSVFVVEPGTLPGLRPRQRLKEIIIFS